MSGPIGSSQWMSTTASIPYIGDRAIFESGLSGTAYTYTDSIEYFALSSLGNGADFGNLNQVRSQAAAVSSKTRGVFCGGYYGAYRNDMDYITIASTGNAADFGDYARPTLGMGGCSDGTRGVLAAGGITGNSHVDIIEYITIASPGGSTDFGDLQHGKGHTLGCSNGIRGIFAGDTAASPLINDVTIDYITILSTGNASDFGDLSHARRTMGGAPHNDVRAMFAGGYAWPEYATVDTIDYITMATTGNAVDFGNMTTTWDGASGTSNGPRGVFGGGSVPGDGWTDIIEYITMATTGNSADFGDLDVQRGSAGACSGE
jgi:hypothetical protein